MREEISPSWRAPGASCTNSQPGRICRHVCRGRGRFNNSSATFISLKLIHLLVLGILLKYIRLFTCNMPSSWEGAAEGLLASLWWCSGSSHTEDVHTLGHTCHYSRGGTTNHAAKYSFRWKASCRHENREVGAASLPSRERANGAGVGGARELQSCNHTGLAGWSHPSVVTALKWLDGYYFHYYCFNAPLWTHRSVQ